MPVVAARRPVVIRRRGPVAAVLSALPRGVEAGLAVGRLRAIWLLLGLFLALNLLVRLGLAVFNGDPSLGWPWRLLPALAIGALFDTGRRRARTGAPGAADRPLAAARRALDTMARGAGGNAAAAALRSAGVRRVFRVHFLERVRVALQLHRGRLPDLHEGSRRQHPRVLQPAAAAVGRGRARAAALGGGVAPAAARLVRAVRRLEGARHRDGAVGAAASGRGHLGRRCALQGVLAQCAAQ